ncbi:MAG: hypothetical protein LWY06_01765 [Firmicutes bacterium]|nr:hypothetical protein [Bacillota bacterium]
MLDIRQTGSFQQRDLFPAVKAKSGEKQPEIHTDRIALSGNSEEQYPELAQTIRPSYKYRQKVNIKNSTGFDMRDFRIKLKSSTAIGAILSSVLCGTMGGGSLGGAIGGAVGMCTD